MKPASIHAKGKRLENKIASLWRSKIGGLAMRTPGSGNGTKFKEDVYTQYYSIECKNQEKVKLWEWWEQTVSEKHLAKPPVLAVSGNFRPILVVMSVDDWLDLVHEAKCENTDQNM